MDLPVSVTTAPSPGYVNFVFVENASADGTASISITPKNFPLPGCLPDTSQCPLSRGERMLACHSAHSGECSEPLCCKNASACSTGGRGSDPGGGGGSPGRCGGR